MSTADFGRVHSTHESLEGNYWCQQGGVGQGDHMQHTKGVTEVATPGNKCVKKEWRAEIEGQT
jgi:hypothetical protein